MKISEKLIAIQSAKLSRYEALKLLAGSSSSLKGALRLTIAATNDDTRDIISGILLNVYSAGFIAGADFQKNEVAKTPSPPKATESSNTP